MPDYSGLGGGIGGLFGGPIGAGIGSLAGGLISGIIGGGQKKKANKILANNIRPDYQIPDEVMENQNIARQQAGEGLPSEQYSQAMKNIQRQQASALRGAQDRRGALMALPGIVQAGNDATLNLDVANANARMSNQRNLMNVNNQVAGYRDKAFDWNKRQKYTDTQNYGMSLLGAGNQNVAGGLEQGAAGLGYLANGLFGNGGGGSRKSAGGGVPQFNMYGSNPDYDYFNR